jgi:hypothetical protein
MSSIADRMFDGVSAEAELEELISDAGVEFDRLGWDYYDCSVELHGVADDARLSVDTQRIVHAAGFAKVYVNHKNGWETHYTWKAGPFEPVRGWRRHMEHNEEPGPSGVTEFKIMKISYWPDTWNGSRLEQDRDAGRILIIPDPFETAVAPSNDDGTQPARTQVVA